MSVFSVRRLLICALTLWAGWSLSGPLHAQTEGETGRAEIRAKRSDLKNVKRRLDDLQRDLEKTEASHAAAALAVAEAEREVSKATRALRQVMAERAEVEQRLAALETEQRKTRERIAARQDELADWLRRNYMYGAANDIAALLAARDPNQFARDVYYLERLGRVRLELIEGLRADLQVAAEQARQIAARRESLVRLEEERRKRQETLEKTFVQRRETLEELGAKLAVQREWVDTLKSDEKRLIQIVDTLAAEAEAARREREHAETQARRDRAPERPSRANTAKTEPVIGRVREIAGPNPGGLSFAQLRGKLNFPVAGELIGNFGTPRAGQGTAWRGVFIRATSGEDVRAVSDGEVVFSDWLRGYGNLLIVDHGSGYLSIYANNDALYKEVGDPVRGGEAIASVGASGTEAESGLYFEIRHRGQAIDPMQWVKLK